MNFQEHDVLYAARKLIISLEKLEVDYDDLRDYIRVLRYNLKKVEDDNEPIRFGFLDKKHVLELCDYWIEGHRKET